MKLKYYKTKSFTVSHSLDCGGDENTIMHCHSHYEMLYFIRGDVIYYIEGKEYHLKEGSLLLIRPGVLHGVKSCSGKTYERCIVHIFADGFDGENRELLDAVFSNSKYYENTDTYQIDEAFDEAFRIAKLGDHPLTVSVLNLLVKVLDMQQNERESEPNAVANDSIGQVINHLNVNFTSHISLDDIAAQFYVSKHHLNKLFRKATGVTVGEYVIYKRVYYARSLIRQGVRANEAAEKAGFSDYSSFYRAFVKRMGHSPQAESPLTTRIN